MPVSIYRKVGIAAVIMMASVFLSRLFGLLRLMAIAYVGGRSADVDAYQVAFVIPEILNHIADLKYSMRTMLLLVAFFGQAVGFATYPFMVRLVVEEKMQQLTVAVLLSIPLYLIGLNLMGTSGVAPAASLSAVLQVLKPGRSFGV